MRYNDLSQSDQELLNTDFGDFEKEAGEKLAEANEVYAYGQEQAHIIADQMDEAMAKFASDDEDEDDEDDEELDEESEKKAAELGSFIERGMFDELTKLGSERYNDPMHYYYPYMEEKVAQIGAEEKVAAIKDIWKATKDMAGRASKSVGDSAASATKKVKSLGNSEGRAAAWDATKKAPGKASTAIKKYHSGIADDAYAAVKGKRRGSKDMLKDMYSRVDDFQNPLKPMDRLKKGLSAGAKVTPHAAALGLTGYGGKKLYDKYGK